MKKFTKLSSMLLAALMAVSSVSVLSLAASLPKVTNLKAYEIDDDEVNLKWSKAQTDIRSMYIMTIQANGKNSANS